MTKRKAVTKKMRFEILKRDGFKCQYCGRSSPEVELHIDHINPVSKGGRTEDGNLITSCRDCNAGKLNFTIDDRIPSLDKSAEKARAASEQIKKMNREAKKRAKEEAALIDQLFAVWSTAFRYENDFTARQKATLKKLVNLLPIDDLVFVMQYTVEKDLRSFSSDGSAMEKRFRYFCGSCWRKVREQEERDGTPKQNQG